MYDAQERANRDYRSSINSAFEEGKRQGILEAKLERQTIYEQVGRIKEFQELLGIAEPTRDELYGYELSQLTELAERLRLQLRPRGD